MLDWNTSFERYLSKLSENPKNFHIGSTVLKLWPLKDVQQHSHVLTYLRVQCVELTVAFKHIPMVVFCQHINSIHLHQFIYTHCSSEYSHHVLTTYDNGAGVLQIWASLMTTCRTLFLSWACGSCRQERLDAYATRRFLEEVDRNYACHATRHIHWWERHGNTHAMVPHDFNPP